MGYKDHFAVDNGSLLNLDNHKHYTAKDVFLVDTFRFEGESNPDDMAILYVLENTDGAKGSLVNSYGTYGDEVIDAFMNDVTRERI